MNTPSTPPRFVVRPRGAFTLIELLTVIAIIGILAAIVIPTVGAVRSRAKSAQCLSNQRQLALGCQLFAQENKDRFPFYREVPPATRENPNPAQIAWYLAISNYTGQKTVDVITDDTRGAGLIHQCPGALLPIASPASPSYAVHRWLFPTQTDPQMPPRISRIPRPSQVVIFADAPQAHAGGHANDTIYRVSLAWWNQNEDPELPVATDGDLDTEEGAGWIRYRHGTSANVAFLDGHVSSMPKGSLKNGNFLLTK